MGSWLDTAEPKKQKTQKVKGVLRYSVMEQMIDDIFTGFETMFSCWEKSMVKSARPATKVGFA
ncbi:MAG TPA: hypothetical protein VIM59_05140, partial [Cellvibrio sp.]